jgi:hypothetical protein
MKLNRVSLTACVALMGAVLVTASCGGAPTSPSLSGPTNLKLMLTDDPIDDVEEVRICFTSVTIKPTDGPVQHRLPLELPVCDSPENPVDLLELQDDAIAFAGGVVEPGSYEFIHINIDEDKSYIVQSGEKKSLQVPSEEIKIVGGFSVGDDTVTTLTLDFDAKASLRLRGNGEWLLTPIVVITGNNTSSQP